MPCELRCISSRPPLHTALALPFATKGACRSPLLPSEWTFRPLKRLPSQE